MRLHIGNISSALAENLSELEKRLEAYGQLESKLELHKKPILDTYFSFVDIDISQDQFTALKRGLNGVTFRQSHLSIQEAKPKWAFNPESPAIQLNPDQMKRSKAHLNEIGVYKGKMREVPRTEPKDISLRLKFPNGKVQKIRTHRQKLWGYEKKLPQNLVYEYTDGEWRDLTGRPVEIAVRNEQDRDARVAADINPGYLSDSDFEEFKQNMDEAGRNEDEWDDNGMEVVSRNVDTSRNDDGDTDEEFYTKLQTNQAQEQDENMFDEQEEPAQESVSKTEALRSMLAPTGGFRLFDGDGDAPEETLETPAPAPSVVPVETRKFGLFFSHSESPFLQTQTQILKLHHSFTPEKWDEEFWQNRGEWNRQLRRRRREEQKMMRRKGVKMQY